MKYRNEDSETKQWQQGYSILSEEVRFEVLERSRSRVQKWIQEVGGREVEFQKLVISLKILHKCVSL